MKWKKWVADYLHFTRKDRIGILVLAGLILFVLFIPALISQNGSGTPAKADSTVIAAFEHLEESKPVNRERKFAENDNDYQDDRFKTGFQKHPVAELFPFDPNNTSAEDWKKLGLTSKLIATIQHYISKGGHFRKPEDFRKVYGLWPDQYERLAPFIRIETTPSPPGENKTVIIPGKTAPRLSPIDINNSDTSAFISLPGIGSKLASRIVNFRDKLGGFYSIEQVAETFGLADSVFQKIRRYLQLENAVIRKININTATVEELKSHPYIRYAIANAIIAYRDQHGLFSSLEDVKKVMAVTDDVYHKLIPYLSL